MAAANAELSRVEQDKRIAIVDADWLPGGDELTPTMKLKCKPILQKCATGIERLYSRGHESLTAFGRSRKKASFQAAGSG